MAKNTGNREHRNGPHTACPACLRHREATGSWPPFAEAKHNGGAFTVRP